MSQTFIIRYVNLKKPIFLLAQKTVRNLIFFLDVINKFEKIHCPQGSSINDVTALGGRGYQGFCDNSAKALVIKSVTMGGGSVKNDQILRDVIYGRPLTSVFRGPFVICQIFQFAIEIGGIKNSQTSKDLCQRGLKRNNSLW